MPSQRDKDHRISYHGAHLRIRAAKGPASNYSCECGDTAQQWAYDYLDPNPLTDERGLFYSGNPDYYRPMCASCHRLHDNEINNSQKEVLF